ncbi:MAG: FtsX-like permease family protein [Candidatus Latescibacteria bacterium]|nr:FtsX-like permease family protein [Candidatus Latescibacterota bacterium]
MLYNYLKIAVRNLLRYRLYSLVNITGLAIGMASFLLITLYVMDELSYDRFHDKAERTYRMATPTNGRLPLWLGSLLEEEIPDVVETVRIHYNNKPLIVSGDKRFYEKIHFVEGNIFDIFDIPFIYGDSQTALSAPRRMVISREIAEKYFGDENPLGKILRWDDRTDYEVTGVVEVPRLTHFHFDILVSETSITWLRDDVWGTEWNEKGAWYYSFTYLLLADPGASYGLADKALDLVGRIKGQEARDVAEKWGGFFLQALPDIHLHSQLPVEIEPNGDIENIYISVAVALLVLLIACINFVNLSTARAVKRGREIGVRKAIGAYRGQLFQQFLAESILLSVAALVLALGLVESCLPMFNAFFDKQLVLVGGAPFLLLGAFVLALLVGAFSGLYPALILSGFQPAKVLKGKTRSSGKDGLLRRGLVVFQFSVSIVMLCAAGVIYSQLDYLKEKKLGYNKDQVLSLFISYPGLNERMPAVEEALRQHSGIVNTASSAKLPGQGLGLKGSLQTVGSSEPLSLPFLNVEPQFIELFEMELLAGRTFSPQVETDMKDGLILNRAALDMLAIGSPQEAVGTLLSYSTQTPGDVPVVSESARLLGVVENAHLQPLHHQITPMAFFYFPSFWAFSYTSIRVHGDNLPETIGFIEDTWDEFIPEFPIAYHFLDDDFAQLYEKEERLGTLLGIFAGLSVFVACLGVFALAVFTVEWRTREIAVRKVLGASEQNVAGLLVWDFTRPALAANLLAWPVAYFALSQWLRNFAYHVDIGLGVFILSSIAVLSVAGLSVGYQTIRAAAANPVHALRGE